MGIAVIFPGQGTQVPHMGDPWRASESWRVVDQAELALGIPISHLLLDADEAGLARTRDAQLAVLVASLMAWDAVRDSLGVPVAFAGHSLGQITALVASGALTLEDGVRLAGQRAERTQEAADRRPGRMAAFVGAGLEQAELACADPGGQECWVANDNAPGQVVVGGTAEGVQRSTDRARALGVRRVVPLNVGAAFHTPLMSDAAAAFSADLADTRFSAPTAPVVCNVDAEAHGDDQWHDRLARHLLSPVRWRQSMQTLVDLGADTFVEVGPGAVLSGLARRTVPNVATRTVSSPQDLPALAEVAN
ncbi:MAG: ACP S-malonyltransferase [Acidimicrobiales bacterium]